MKETKKKKKKKKKKEEIINVIRRRGEEKPAIHDRSRHFNVFVILSNHLFCDKAHNIFSQCGWPASSMPKKPRTSLSVPLRPYAACIFLCIGSVSYQRPPRHAAAVRSTVIFRTGRSSQNFFFSSFAAICFVSVSFLFWQP